MKNGLFALISPAACVIKALFLHESGSCCLKAFQSERLGFCLTSLAGKARGMARKDAVTSTRTKRSQLPYNPNGHARILTDGVALLYYPSKVKGRAGTWGARRYLGEKRYERILLGDADDLPGSVGDGVKVFDFAQAEKAARAWATAAASAAQKADKAGAATVGDAVRAYVAERLQRAPKAGSDAQNRLGHHVLNALLAEVALADLRESDLEAWRAGLTRGVRGRAPKDGAVKAKPPSPPMATATLARLLNDLRAALNAANRRHKIGGDFSAVIAEGLRAPEGSQSARGMQVLSDSHVAQIVAGAQSLNADFGALVLVLAATGCRFDQAARITVGDVQPGNGRVMIPTSHKGKGEKAVTHIAFPLPDRDMDALAPLTFGRGSDEPLLMRWHHKRAGGASLTWARDGRRAWSVPAEMTRDWRAACAAAGLPASVVPYALRHSSIVRMLKAGLPIRLVAAVHDTSVAMIEKTYAKFIVDASEALLRAATVPMTRPVGGDVVQMPLRRA